MISKTAKVVLTVSLIGFIYLVMANKNKLGKVTATNKIRGCDELGCGNFGAKRTTHIHQGIDLVTKVGEPIYAPLDCVIKRITRPDKNDNVLKGIVLQSGNLEIKIFYFLPNVVSGKVKAGQIIGYAQSIAKKYGSKITNHIHLEVRENGVLVNPANLF